MKRKLMVGTLVTLAALAGTSAMAAPAVVATGPNGQQETKRINASRSASESERVRLTV